MQKLRILVVGPPSTGKSIICNSLYDPQMKQIPLQRPTIGVRIIDLEKIIQIKTKNYNTKIQLIEISGNPQYEQFHMIFQDNIDGVIIVCNADIPSQTQNLQKYINDFPRKLRIPPSLCLGLFNHLGTEIKNMNPLKFAKLDFFPCSFEQKSRTTIPLFENYIKTLLEQKMNKDSK